MIGVAAAAAESSNHQMICYTAFLFADPLAGIPVMERTVADGAHMGSFTAFNKNTKIPLEDQRVI